MNGASQLYVVFYVLSLVLIIIFLFLIYLSSTKKAKEVLISVLSTLFINNIKWSGYRYKISKGNVKSITEL